VAGQYLRFAQPSDDRFGSKADKPSRAKIQIFRCCPKADKRGCGRIVRFWDAAFDRGLISFADEATYWSEAARKAPGVATAPPLNGLRDAHRANLALHRARNGF
jgi:hypothetical protein